MDDMHVRGGAPLEGTGGITPLNIDQKKLFDSCMSEIREKFQVSQAEGKRVVSSSILVPEAALPLDIASKVIHKLGAE